MCKPRLNSSEDFRKGLEQHLRTNMIQHQQFPKVGRLSWWQRLLDRIERIFEGRQI